MKFAMYTLLLSCFLFSSAWAASGVPKGRPADGKTAKVTVFKGDPVLGRDKAESERCQECHGVDGNGAGHANGPEGKFAKLAGQLPQYILKQIQDFRSGARKHDQMAIMARSVSDEDVADIAAYFHAQPLMQGDGSGRYEVADRLFNQGDSARGIPACASCHGLQGRGPTASPLTPVIGGQEWRYLEKQLLDWRSGDRKNSADGVMNQVTRKLTDAEVQALADYLSTR